MSSLLKAPWIQHFSKSDIINGTHYFEPHNTSLISINDVGATPPLPMYHFKQHIILFFEDVDNPADPESITSKQARMIAQLLRTSYAQRTNVVVHCHAGLCRSSAVAIVGQQTGFTLEVKTRLPNQLVMHRMMVEMGLPDTSAAIAQYYKTKARIHDQRLGAYYGLLE